MKTVTLELFTFNSGSSGLLARVGDTYLTHDDGTWVIISHEDPEDWLPQLLNMMGADFDLVGVGDIEAHLRTHYQEAEQLEAQGEE